MSGVAARSVPRAGSVRGLLLASLLLASLLLAGCAGVGAGEGTSASSIRIDGAEVGLDRVVCDRDPDVPPDAALIGHLGEPELTIRATGQGPDGVLRVDFVRVRTGQELVSDVLSVGEGEGGLDLLAVGSTLATPRQWDVEATVTESGEVAGTATMEPRDQPGDPVPVAFSLVCPG